MSSYQCLDGLDDAVLHPKQFVRAKSANKRGLGALAQDVQPVEVARTGHGLTSAGHVPTAGVGVALRSDVSSGFDRRANPQIELRCSKRRRAFGCIVWPHGNSGANEAV